MMKTRNTFYGTSPIDRTSVVSYSTSSDTIIASVTVFEIFDVHFSDLELGQFKVNQGQSS